MLSWHKRTRGNSVVDEPRIHGYPRPTHLSYMAYSPIGISTSNPHVLHRGHSRSGLHSASMIIHMSWAQIRLAAYSQGSRPSAEVPETIYPLHPQRQLRTRSNPVSSQHECHVQEVLRTSSDE